MGMMAAIVGGGLVAWLARHMVDQGPDADLF